MTAITLAEGRVALARRVAAVAGCLPHLLSLDGARGNWDELVVATQEADALGLRQRWEEACAALERAQELCAELEARWERAIPAETEAARRAVVARLDADVLDAATRDDLTRRAGDAAFSGLGLDALAEELGATLERQRLTRARALELAEELGRSLPEDGRDEVIAIRRSLAEAGAALAERRHDDATQHLAEARRRWLPLSGQPAPAPTAPPPTPAPPADPPVDDALRASLADRLEVARTTLERARSVASHPAILPDGALARARAAAREPLEALARALEATPRDPATRGAARGALAQADELAGRAADLEADVRGLPRPGAQLEAHRTLLGCWIDASNLPPRERAALRGELERASAWLDPVTEAGRVAAAELLRDLRDALDREERARVDREALGHALASTRRAWSKLRPRFQRHAALAAAIDDRLGSALTDAVDDPVAIGAEVASLTAFLAEVEAARDWTRPLRRRAAGLDHSLHARRPAPPVPPPWGAVGEQLAASTPWPPGDAVPEALMDTLVTALPEVPGASFEATSLVLREWTAAAGEAAAERTGDAELARALVAGLRGGARLAQLARGLDREGLLALWRETVALAPLAPRQDAAQLEAADRDALAALAAALPDAPTPARSGEVAAAARLAAGHLPSAPAIDRRSLVARAQRAHAQARADAERLVRTATEDLEASAAAAAPAPHVVEVAGRLALGGPGRVATLLQGLAGRGALTRWIGALLGALTAEVRQPSVAARHLEPALQVLEAAVALAERTHLPAPRRALEPLLDVLPGRRDAPADEVSERWGDGPLKEAWSLAERALRAPGSPVARAIGRAMDPALARDAITWGAARGDWLAARALERLSTSSPVAELAVGAPAEPPTPLSAAGWARVLPPSGWDGSLDEVERLRAARPAWLAMERRARAHDLPTANDLRRWRDALSLARRALDGLHPPDPLLDASVAGARAEVVSAWASVTRAASSKGAAPS